MTHFQSNMQIIKHRKIYFAISGTAVAASVVAIAVFGLKLGIDFTGGSLMEISIADERIAADAGAITAVLTSGEEPALAAVRSQPTRERGFLLRFKHVSEDEHQAILGRLNTELAKQLPEEERTNAPKADDSSAVSGIQATDAAGNPVNVSVEAAPVAESPTITIGGVAVVAEERF